MTDFKGERPYRLIALDIDGTLVNRQGDVADKTLAAIHELHFKGIQVTFATGRIWPSVEYLVRRFHLILPVILHNGALIREVKGEAVLYRYALETPLFQKVLSLLEGLSFDYLICSLSQGKEHILYPEDLEHVWARSFLESYSDYSLSLDGLPLNGHSILRVLVFGEQKKVCDLKKRLKREDLKVLFFTGPWESAYMEIFKRGCSKATGLAFLVQRLGIQREEVLVIGDDMNDLEMIQYAGCGVAMGTAPGILQDAADYVTLSAEEGGVGEALQRLVL